jgi:hypothetical protein
MLESKIIRRPRGRYEATVYIGTSPELGEMWQDCGTHSSARDAAQAIALYIALQTGEVTRRPAGREETQAKLL